MSKFVAFIAAPSKKDSYRTGKLRVAKLSSTPGPIKSYGLDELTEFELKDFMAQLGFAKEAKKMSVDDMVAMLEKEFSTEVNQMDLKQFKNETEGLDEEELQQMAMENFTAGNRVLRIGSHESLKQVLTNVEQGKSRLW